MMIASFKGKAPGRLWKLSSRIPVPSETLRTQPAILYYKARGKLRISGEPDRVPRLRRYRPMLSFIRVSPVSRAKPELVCPGEPRAGSPLPGGRVYLKAAVSGYSHSGFAIRRERGKTGTRLDSPLFSKSKYAGKPYQSLRRARCAMHRTPAAASRSCQS